MNEPDWELLLKSAIWGKKVAYEAFKKSINDAYKYTFVGVDGEMIGLEGQEERNQKVLDCWKEVERLDYEIQRIRNEIERVKNESYGYASNNLRESICRE